MYNSANYEKTVPGAVRHVVPGATHGYDKVSWQKELLEYTRKYVNDIMGDQLKDKTRYDGNIREIEDKFPDKRYGAGQGGNMDQSGTA